MCPFDHKFIPLDSMRLYCERCGFGKTWSEASDDGVFSSSPTRKKSRRKSSPNKREALAMEAEPPTPNDLEAEQVRLMQELVPEYFAPSNVPVYDDEEIDSGSMY